MQIFYTNIIRHKCSANDSDLLHANIPLFSYRATQCAVLCYNPVCPSVRLSQADVRSKQLNIPSRKRRRKIAQGLSFSDAKDVSENLVESPPTRARKICNIREIAR